ncbi:MAG: phosphoribosylglycinamide formyltransferase [Clostridia bacterium]
MRWAALVGGTGSNLRALIAAGCPIALVVSHRPGVGALDIADAAGIPHIVLDPRQHSGREAYDAALLDVLREADIEALVLAGFLRILTAPVVRAYAGRAVNVHPSLLPAFQGLHAVRQALDYGVRVTGVTVHIVDEGLDSGPIIFQEALTVHPDDDEETLSERIHAIEHRLLPAAVRLLDQQHLSVIGRQVYIREE